jgi:signal peptidase II
VSWLPPKVRVFSVVALVSLVLDRATKSWVEAELAFGEQRTLIEGWLHVTHVRNRGAAFGLFAEADAELKAIVFGGAAALALAVVLLHLIGLARGERRVAAALGLVAGGALGNLFDRLPMLGDGEVIDFLHLDLWSGYDWPDFNVADIAIVLGVAGLLVDMIARESVLRADREPVDTDGSRA